MWCSKIQTEIALSTNKSEYIALSQAIQEVIPFIDLMIEVGDVFTLHNLNPKFHCKVFEENHSCVKVMESPIFTPRTKKITTKYHRVKSFVADGSIKIFPIDTKDTLADIFTKTLDKVISVKWRRILMEW